MFGARTSPLQAVASEGEGDQDCRETRCAPIILILTLAYGLADRQGESAAVDRPLLRLRRAALGSFSFKGGDLRLEFRNGLALTLRLVRELPQALQDLADEVLGPCVGVHDADYSVSARRTTLRASCTGASTCRRPGYCGKPRSLFSDPLPRWAKGLDTAQRPSKNSTFCQAVLMPTRRCSSRTRVDTTSTLTQSSRRPGKQREPSP